MLSILVIIQLVWVSIGYTFLHLSSPYAKGVRSTFVSVVGNAEEEQCISDCANGPLQN